MFIPNSAKLNFVRLYVDSISPTRKARNDAATLLLDSITVANFHVFCVITRLAGSRVSACDAIGFCGVDCPNQNLAGTVPILDRTITFAVPFADEHFGTFRPRAVDPPTSCAFTLGSAPCSQVSGQIPLRNVIGQLQPSILAQPFVQHLRAPCHWL